jgi:hypothetical protein
MPRDTRKQVPHISSEPGHAIFDPSWAIRNDFDATIVLLLWCLRKSFFPLLWLGMTVATVVFTIVDRNPNEAAETLNSLSGPTDYAGALLSPLVLVVIAFTIRIGAGLLAFAAAYPLSAAATANDGPELGRFTRRWFDRIYLTRGYRALRWTWRVRTEAADRLERRGSILTTCSTALRWASVLLFVLFVVVTIAALAIVAT